MNACRKGVEIQQFATDGWSIWQGRHQLGTVVKEHDGFVARTCELERVGEPFTTFHQAAHALEVR